MNRTVRGDRVQGPGERVQRRWAVAPWTLFGLFLAVAGVAFVLDAQAYATQASAQGGLASWLGRRLLSLGFLIPAFVFALTGTLIASRRPGNRMGWIMLSAGTSLGVAGLATSYALNAIGASPSDPPFVGVIAHVAEFPASSVGFLLALVFTPILFPDGDLPSPRWRPLPWLAVLLVVLDALRSVFTRRLEGSLSSFGPGPMPVYDIPNPLTVDWMQPVASLGSTVGSFIALGLILASVAGVVVRFRRSEGVERQQMKWFAFAAAIVGVFISVIAAGAALGAPGWLQAALGLMALTAYPAAVGIAVLRYRLYEIDRIISRTVSYGLVVAVLAAVYVAGILGLGAAVTALTGQGDSDLVVAVSTLAAAGLFRPVRARIQTAVDRRFNRTGYEARRAVDAFTRDVRDEVDLEQIREQLAETAAVATQPTQVSVWLPTGTDSARG